MPEPLLAVDAPSVLFRAFYALPGTIRGAEGQPVNALLGGVNIVLREVLQHRPRGVVMCFGDDAATYRVELFDGYHADRGPVPDELGPQIEAAPALYRALGWRVHDERGLEADDLLNSYALSEQRAGGRALILTGDRDMYQCAGDSCTILYLRTGGRGAELVDAAEVERRYGIPPALVPDFIALRGDPSDGLPGARGVGEKTAADILRSHGSLESALDAALDGTSLAGARDQLRAFKDIATLRPPAVKPPPDRETDRAGGAAAAEKLGMNRLAKRLGE